MYSSVGTGLYTYLQFTYLYRGLCDMEIYGTIELPTIIIIIAYTNLTINFNNAQGKKNVR